MLQKKPECIILAGGLGTRLRESIGLIPKCIAPVANRPFLHYLLDYLSKAGAGRIVLSLGYKSEIIIDWLKHVHYPFVIDWVVEQEALGTGGGIHLALAQCSTDHVFVLNGDTMFTINLNKLLHRHQQSGAETTIALKEMLNIDRYGTVQLADDGTVISFKEKGPVQSGLINGGIYLINRKTFMQRSLPGRFSFEKDYLEQAVSEGCIYGLACDAYFIDIGVPRDYQQVQLDFQTGIPS